MNKVSFTEYTRPNGAARKTECEVSPEHAKTASKIERKGYVFEAETLSTQEVSLTVMGPVGDEDEGDIAFEIYPAGEHPKPHVEALIDKAQKIIFS